MKIKSAAAKLDIEIDQGTSGQIILDLLMSEEGPAFDLTGYDASLIARDARDNLVADLSTTNGKITITDNRLTITWPRTEQRE